MLLLTLAISNIESTNAQNLPSATLTCRLWLENCSQLRRSDQIPILGILERLVWWCSPHFLCLLDIFHHPVCPAGWDNSSACAFYEKYLNFTAPPQHFPSVAGIGSVAHSSGHQYHHRIDGWNKSDYFDVGFACPNPVILEIECQSTALTWLKVKKASVWRWTHAAGRE